jgi:hypothetical protein
MNELIQRLKLQAGINDNPDQEGLDLFAELIVRECLNQCYNRGMNDELYAGQLKAATYIEEHFGVEEK